MNKSTKPWKTPAKQGGYMNLDFGSLIVGLVVLTALVAAPIGWLLIEGVIWLSQHVAIGWK
jgi:hypothetical protein